MKALKKGQLVFRCFNASIEIIHSFVYLGPSRVHHYTYGLVEVLDGKGRIAYLNVRRLGSTPEEARNKSTQNLSYEEILNPIRKDEIDAIENENI